MLGANLHNFAEGKFAIYSSFINVQFVLGCLKCYETGENLLILVTFEMIPFIAYKLCLNREKKA